MSGCAGTKNASGPQMYGAQKTVTVGTVESKASLDTNFGNIQDNFDELWAALMTQAYLTSSSPTFAGLSLGTASTTTGLLNFYGNAKAFSFGLFSQGADAPSIGWRLPSTLPAGTYLITSDTNGYLSYLDPATLGGDDLGAAAASDVIALFNTGTCSGYLKSDGTCDTPSGAADDTVYDATSWDANTDAATKNAIRDKIETLSGGHDAVTIGATANGLSLSTQVLSLGLASTSTIGALSDTDWDTFNNKVSYTPATPGAIGGTTPAAGTFTTVTATTYSTSAADGSRKSELPSNTTATPTGGGVVEIYNEAGVIKVVMSDTESAMGYTVAAGTSALATAEIASGACATAITTAATGTATTDVINWGFNGDPTGITGYAPTTNGMLTIIAYPSANNVNYRVCNNTAAAITPGAITLNWKVQR